MERRQETWTPRQRRRRDGNEPSVRTPFFDHTEDYEPDDYASPFQCFETGAEASQRRTRLEQTLWRERASRPISKRLRECGRKARCLSGACPSCKRRFRRWLVLEGARAIQADWGDGELAFITVVIPGTRVARGRLHQFDMDAFKERMSKRVIRAGLGHCRIIGGVDWSLNARASSPERRWQPHLHAIVQCPDGSKVLRRKLNAAIKPTASTPRPVKVAKVSALRSGLGYCMKAFAQCRVRYVDRNNRRQTRKLPLKGPEIREMAIFQDQHPIHAPLFLRNVRRRGSRLVTAQSELS